GHVLVDRLARSSVLELSYPADMPARWNDDYTAAVLLDDDGFRDASLQLERWYDWGKREPGVAWTVSFLDPGANSPIAVAEVVEYPASPADSPERRAALVALASRRVE